MAAAVAACLALADVSFAQNPLNVSLSGTTTTQPYREYSTRELGDPWDMTQRTDIGWFTWGVDSPPHNMTSFGLATDGLGNRYFRGLGTAAGPSFTLLDTWLPGAAKLGKNGAMHPIDTTIYNTLYLKMKVANQVLNQLPVIQVYWSRDSIYPGATTPLGGTMQAVTAANVPTGIFMTPGTAQPFGSVEGGTWVLYRVPLTIAAMQAINATVHHWHTFNGTTNANWGSAGVMADSLRISPFHIAGSTVGEYQVDWARLVNETAGSATTISWSGGGTYDIVVSTQANCSDFTVVAYSKTSGYAFQSQLLAPGTYRVGLRLPFQNGGHTAASGTTLASCSTGTFTVQSLPSLTITSPKPEGSDDDFATTVLGNAWDFNALADIDYGVNVNYPDATFGIVNRSATDLAGNDLGSVRVYRNQSTAAAAGQVGDPHIYTLWRAAGARGLTNRIDATKYRILTAEIGVEHSRALVPGSVGRIIWHVDGEKRLSDGGHAEIESEDIVLRHLNPATENGGKITIETLQADMADRWTLPVDSLYAQPASGWNNTCTAQPGLTQCSPDAYYSPGVDMFRWDFHEFPEATNSYIRRLKLAALERTGSSFQVSWTAANPSALAATVTLKAVPVANPGVDNRPAEPTCGGISLTIASGVSLAGGSYNWTPATTAGLLPDAEYYVCAQIVVGGTTVDEVMSRWPVVTQFLDEAPFTASPSSLKFGATKSGSTITAVTPPQAVAVSGGAGMAWTATANRTWIQVTNGAGTGAGQFTVGIVNPGNVIGGSTNLTGAVTITPTTPGFQSTTVNVALSVDQSNGAATQPPFGLTSSPAPNAVVQGAVGITGWVLDDIGVERVRLYRNCLSFENQAACQMVAGYNVVFMGDATLVTGARPDIEAAYPTYPAANRAGWGYAMLSNLSPHIPLQQMFGGQGPLTIYIRARDVEGKEAWIGQAFLPGSTTASDQLPTPITMANDTIAKPFGTIDTPLQGQTVSGSFWNWGWALTPDSNAVAGDAGDILIPTNGSTIRVWIDGASPGTVTYNQCRGLMAPYCIDDIASIFGNTTPRPIGSPRASNPTKFRNLDANRGAIGGFFLNTTSLTNGVHTIAWAAFDNATPTARGDGLGSRYFTVLNTGTDADRRQATGDRRQGEDRDLGSGASSVTLSRRDTTDPRSPVPDPRSPADVLGRTGFSLDAPLVELRPDADGIRHVQIDEMGRLELQFPWYVEQGYLVVNDEYRPLPVGSRFDAETGTFTWAPGVGFIGTYRLAFGRAGSPNAADVEWGRGTSITDPRSRVPGPGEDLVLIDVTIRPASPLAPGEAAIRMSLDTPQLGATVSGPFLVAGWALDPHAAIGSGIGAVHVWAQRTDAPGEAPVFLGAATLDGSRPDVGGIYGPQFDRPGFNLASSVSLEPGTYNVTAYVWVSRTARWEDARTATITVR